MRHLHLNVFEMNSIGHMSPGLWAHPTDQRHMINDLSFWERLSAVAEQAQVESIFFADVLGLYDDSVCGAREAVRRAVQVPINDATMLIPAMAARAKSLCFCVTASTTYEDPQAFASRTASLVRFTAGRTGWNIVTSFLPSAARNFGHSGEVSHEQRYAKAERFMGAMYKAWDAGQIDADMSGSSVPLLIQATNGSAAGISFAATHAEVVLVGGNTREQVRNVVGKIKGAATALGREDGSIKFLVNAGFILDETERLVQEKVRELKMYYNARGKIAQGQWAAELLGLDEEAGLASASLSFDVRARLIERAATGENVGDTIERVGGMTQSEYFRFCTPDTALSLIEQWLDEDGIDGINLRQYHSYGSITDFGRLVVPLLADRGRIGVGAAEGRTLRERYFGLGMTAPRSDHPAISRHRRSLSR